MTIEALDTLLAEIKSAPGSVDRVHVFSWAQRHGYKLDRWGHWRKQVASGMVWRITLSKVAVRLERQVRYTDGKTSWVKVRSGYYRNMYLTQDDKLGGWKK